MINLNMLRPIVLVQPCKNTQRQIDEIGSQRFLNLSKLEAEREGLCVWCSEGLTGKRRRWCSDDCASSAQFILFPQEPASKMHRLIHQQHCACAMCGLSFEEEIQKLINRRHFIRKKYDKDKWDGKVSYYEIGYGTGHRWQTDHIVPLCKGGLGIDPDNLQVLCLECHKEKTKGDLK